MGASTQLGTGNEQAEESGPPPYSLVDDGGGLVAESGNVQGMAIVVSNDVLI
jgi:hypothetical protein